ncbi:hypothetical protein [Lactobacillus sp. PSON]|uniref:hypothetical protein n=1 Tax=Lactobacillus sp. PSON TaxID=3455454 RepID=UPI0040430800
MIDLNGFQAFTFTTGENTMTVTSYGIRFSKATIVQLGMPRYVNILINYDSKEFAIKVTNSSDIQKTQFLNPERKKMEVQWNNSLLKDNLVNLMGWDLKNVSYKIKGKYIPDQSLMLFDLKEAKVEKK